MAGYKMNLFLFLLLIGTKVFFIACESNCIKFRTCGECIGYADDTCIWCAANDYDGKRCQPESSKLSNATWCEGQLYNPKMTKEIVRNEDFNRGENKEKVIQFKPQLVKIKARPGVPVKINMSYKPAKDFPLDVYYLVDYSQTMISQVKTLREQGKSIYEGLLNVTNNVRLGIGSFVEKPSMPFVDITFQNSYSFKNHLSLTDNTVAFAKALEAEPSGVNYDLPEAGLDALMQVMTCKKEIGWRDMARRIIVLSTDSTYHSAGDGKFVGAFIPNDMACHLVDNMYTEDLKFDYPSVSQINKVATANNFMIIFAAVPDVKAHYVALEKYIQGVKYAPLERSPKLLEMIRTEYLSLIRNMQLEYDIPDFMRFTTSPDCSKPGECILQHDQHIDIEGTLVIDSCPPADVFTYTLKVGPRFLDEKLTIIVEVDCQCDCEKAWKGEMNSKKCSSNGTYQCGVCKCYENRHGDTCQCAGERLDARDSDKCKAADDAVALCSARGTCSCGKCTCDKDFSGQYCEYDDKACVTADGRVCYGNGKCKFGKCQCDAQWLPEFCLCPVDDSRCIAPQSQEVCSGNGECVCGKCVCNIRKSDHGKCSGTFCDDCEEVAKRCKELEDYAYCNLKNNKTDCDSQYNITAAKVTLVNKTEINSDEYFDAKMWCNKIVEDNKIFMFKYYYPNLSTLRLIIQTELESPPVPNYIIAAASVIAAILLIGIITVIVWKILVDLHDKREYVKFATESEMAGYDITDNPHYEPPTMKFTNPVYTG